MIKEKQPLPTVNVMPCALTCSVAIEPAVTPAAAPLMNLPFAHTATPLGPKVTAQPQLHVFLI